MSLSGDGKTALAAIVKEAALFPRIKPADWSAAAVKLAKKQVISAGLTASDLETIRSTIGRPVFEKTLDDLTAFQAKLLAKRVDPSVTQSEIASKSMALTVIRDRLKQGDLKQDVSETKTAETEEAAPPKPKSNPYIGRKAFRVR